jgi:hypothetical protein
MTRTAHRHDESRLATSRRTSPQAVLHAVTTVTTGETGRVHLTDRSELSSAHRTLCGLAVARLSAPGSIWVRPCHECVAVAVTGGLRLASDGHALINLQRIPLD